MNFSFSELKTACHENDIDRAKVIYTNIIGSLSTDNIIEIFTLVCWKNDIDFAKWIYERNKMDFHVDREGIFRRACNFGHFEMAKWLYSLDGKVNIHVRNEYPFRMACESGNIDLVKWLYDLDGKIKINTRDEEAFCNACKNGHIDIAKWLLSLDSNIINRFNRNSVFSNACRNGHLEVAKWLYNDDVDIYYNSPFMDACENGHVEVAQWLYSLTDDVSKFEINKFFTGLFSYNGKLALVQFLQTYINNDNINECFVSSCRGGNLDIAQWLYSLEIKPDIHYNNNKPFIEACDNSRINIAIWLKSICDDYYFEVTHNEYGDYINDYYIISKGKSIKSLLKDKDYDKICDILKIKKEDFEINKEDKCSICYNENYNFMTSCNHTFCFECFFVWYCDYDRSNCSLCTQEIDFEKCRFKS
jgi:hypothetical protein